MNIETAIAAIAAVAARELHWQAWDAANHGPAAVVGYAVDVPARPCQSRIKGPRACYASTWQACR
jgi:hypothetical protein